MGYYKVGQSRSDLDGGRDEGRKSKMVNVCKEDISQCREVRLTMDHYKRGRSKKYKALMFRLDMTQLQLTEDTTSNKKLWWIVNRVEVSNIG